MRCRGEAGGRRTGAPGFPFPLPKSRLFGVQVAQHSQGDHMPRFSRHVFHDRLGICLVLDAHRRRAKNAATASRPARTPACLRQPFPPRPPKGREPLHGAGCRIGLEGGQANLDQLRGGLDGVPVCTDQRQRLDDFEARVPGEHLDVLCAAEACLEFRRGRTVEQADRQDFPALAGGSPRARRWARSNVALRSTVRPIDNVSVRVPQSEAVPVGGDPKVGLGHREQGESPHQQDAEAEFSHGGRTIASAVGHRAGPCGARHDRSRIWPSAPPSRIDAAGWLSRSGCASGGSRSKCGRGCPTRDHAPKSNPVGPPDLRSRPATAGRPGRACGRSVDEVVKAPVLKIADEKGDAALLHHPIEMFQCGSDVGALPRVF